MNAIITLEENEEEKIFLRTEMPNLDELVKEGIISSLTAEKVKITKSIIENKYYKLFKRQKTQEKNWIKIDQYLSTINTLTEAEKDEIKLLAKIKENQILKLFRRKISIKVSGKLIFADTKETRKYTQ